MVLLSSRCFLDTVTAFMAILSLPDGIKRLKGQTEGEAHRIMVTSKGSQAV